MVEGSHSAFNAPRHLLPGHFLRRGAPLYGAVLPRVITPRGSVEAVLSGRTDVAPLDGYYRLLLRRHAPETAAKIRVVARTSMATIPLFTASRGTDPDDAERLRSARETLRGDAESAGILADLAIRRFARVQPRPLERRRHFELMNIHVQRARMRQALRLDPIYRGLQHAESLFGMGGRLGTPRSVSQSFRGCRSPPPRRKAP